MALAINSVFDASGMVTGGFSGIAIIIKAGSQGIIDGGIPLWVTDGPRLRPGASVRLAPHRVPGGGISATSIPIHPAR